MYTKIVNSAYSYGNDGVVGYSTGVQLWSATPVEVPGATKIYETSVSAKINIESPSWRVDLNSQALAEISRIKADYIRTMQVVVQAFPGVSSPKEALAQFSAAIETEANK